MSLSELTAIIITHKSANPEIIGRIGEKSEAICKTLRPLVRGLVILWTCNRFEIYISTEEPKRAINVLRNIVKEEFNLFTILNGEKAARHLFRVASGLESVALGEYEILGQVKESWLNAKKLRHSDDLLDPVFYGAIVAGRRARAETGISRGAIGVPEAAISLASNLVSGLKNKRILIIGAGMAAKKMLDHICKERPSSIVIANRTLSKAEKLKETLKDCNLNVVSFERLNVIKPVDVSLIAIKGNINLDFLVDLSKVVIDISTPSTVNKLPEKVFTIEDVNMLTALSLEKRLKEIPKVEKIIEEELSRLKVVLSAKRAEKVISAIMLMARDLMKKEIRRSKRKMNENISDKVLEKALWSYTKKVFRPLMELLRNLALNGNYELLNSIYEYYTSFSQRGEKHEF